MKEIKPIILYLVLVPEPINYGSGSDFLTSYGSASQKATVPTVPVSQHCLGPVHSILSNATIYVSLEAFYIFCCAGAVPAGGELPRDVGEGPRPPQQDRERDHGGGAPHPRGQKQGPEVHCHSPPHPHCGGPGTALLHLLKNSVLRIRDVYPGSDFFFPSQIRTVSIPDPGSALKNSSILTQNNGF
jgi:hypothetical protein